MPRPPATPPGWLLPWPALQPQRLQLLRGPQMRMPQDKSTHTWSSELGARIAEVTPGAGATCSLTGTGAVSVTAGTGTMGSITLTILLPAPTPPSIPPSLPPSLPPFSHSLSLSLTRARSCSDVLRVYSPQRPLVLNGSKGPDIAGAHSELASRTSLALHEMQRSPR